MMNPVNSWPGVHISSLHVVFSLPVKTRRSLQWILAVIQNILLEMTRTKAHIEPFCLISLW